ncbi:hypothetical protein B0H11DRAFT_219458 [Mycena galericulata]|nr:hypothetical protein B0H11DRAFT_219458 [Mycena galericulata]
MSPRWRTRRLPLEPSRCSLQANSTYLGRQTSPQIPLSLMSRRWPRCLLWFMILGVNDSTLTTRGIKFLPPTQPSQHLFKLTRYIHFFFRCLSFLATGSFELCMVRLLSESSAGLYVGANDTDLTMNAHFGVQTHTPAKVMQRRASPNCRGPKTASRTARRSRMDALAVARHNAAGNEPQRETPHARCGRPHAASANSHADSWCARSPSASMRTRMGVCCARLLNPRDRSSQQWRIVCAARARAHARTHPERWSQTHPIPQPRGCTPHPCCPCLRAPRRAAVSVHLRLLMKRSAPRWRWGWRRGGAVPDAEADAVDTGGGTRSMRMLRVLVFRS